MIKIYCNNCGSLIQELTDLEVTNKLNEILSYINISEVKHLNFLCNDCKEIEIEK
jgi:hypothetical protein